VEELGFYAAAVYFLVGQSTVLVAVADAARPRLARLYVEQRGQFAGLCGRLAALAAGLAGAGVCIALVAGQGLLQLIYGDAYATQAGLLSWVMIAAIPWNLAGVAGTALAAARRFRALTLSFLAMGLVTALASVCLIPRFGAVGAAWALSLGMTVRLAASAPALWSLRECDARQGEDLLEGRLL
jgi:O-antigen/teichoic acid export membrane protein